MEAERGLRRRSLVRHPGQRHLPSHTVSYQLLKTKGSEGGEATGPLQAEETPAGVFQKADVGPQASLLSTGQQRRVGSKARSYKRVKGEGGTCRGSSAGTEQPCASGSIASSHPQDLPSIQTHSDSPASLTPPVPNVRGREMNFLVSPAQ